MPKSVRHAKNAGKTNTHPHSLVAVIVKSDSGEWVKPNTGDKFYIDEIPRFPEISFEIKTEMPPPYQWQWTIDWDAKVSGLAERTKRGRKLKSFTQSGNFSSDSKIWTADLGPAIIGGKLSVSVTAGQSKFRRTVFVQGKNPVEEDVLSFLKTIPNTIGFDKIIKQESNFKNFINADGEPVVAIDAGYGMTQLTNPAPSYDQAWNWKDNISAGAHLFQQKQILAKHYLGQQNRRYTDDQLSLETISRWNGGGYHTWNIQSQTWERNADMLCDPATGNIGWDTTDTANSDKSVEDLHQRDKATYGSGPTGHSNEHDWKYTGVCYADHVVNP